MTIPDIDGAFYKYFTAKAPIPANHSSIWASQIGFPCERRLALLQVAGAERPRMSAQVMMRIAIGDMIDREYPRILEDALREDVQYRDCRVIHHQIRIPDNDYNIHGKLDCSVLDPDTYDTDGAIPTEIKSFPSYAFDKINTLEDLLTHKNVHYRKYPGQIAMYMYFLEVKRGLIILINKDSGEPKPIEVGPMDEYAALLLERAVGVTKSVQLFKSQPESNDKRWGHLPPILVFQPSICGRCEFCQFCVPDTAAIPDVDNLMDDQELNDICRVVFENKQLASEFEQAQDRLNFMVAIIVGKIRKPGIRTIALADYNVEVRILAMSPRDRRKRKPWKIVGIEERK